MSYGTSPARYLENNVVSRSPEWLVPLMYEHLLSRLQRARVQIESRDLEGKSESLAKANEIILELSASLDSDRGGEIAEQLQPLYAFFAGEILTAGRTNDAVLLGRLVTMIGELHEAWVQAAEQVAPRGRSAAHRVDTATV